MFMWLDPESKSSKRVICWLCIHFWLWLLPFCKTGQGSSKTTLPVHTRGRVRKSMDQPRLLVPKSYYIFSRQFAKSVEKCSSVLNPKPYFLDYVMGSSRGRAVHTLALAWMPLGVIQGQSIVCIHARGSVCHLGLSGARVAQQQILSSTHEAAPFKLYPMHVLLSDIQTKHKSVTISSCLYCIYSQRTKLMYSSKYNSTFCMGFCQLGAFKYNTQAKLKRKDSCYYDVQCHS